MSEEMSINERMKRQFGWICNSLKNRPYLFPDCNKGGAVRRSFNFDGYVCDPGISEAVAGYYASVIEILQEKCLFDLTVFLKNVNRDGNSIAGAMALSGLISTARDVWMPHIHVQLADGICPNRVSYEADIGRDGTRQEKVVLLVDQISDSEEVLRAVDFLESRRYKVTDVIALFVWPDLLGQEFTDKLMGAGVTLHYLGELKQIVDSEEIDSAFNEELLSHCGAKPRD
jgi:hypothetical protein